MKGEALWNTVISGLSSSGEEVQTTTGLWFTASSRDGRLYVGRAIPRSTERFGFLHWGIKIKFDSPLQTAVRDFPRKI